MAVSYNKIRFLWRGDSGRKLSGSDYDKIYDMGPRAATGDVTFSSNKPGLNIIDTDQQSLQVAASELAELVSAAPSGAKGTILAWINHARPVSGSFQLLESDTGTAAQRIQLSVDLDGDLNARGRGAEVNVPTLAYETGSPTTWFYAIVFDTNVFKVWRGDVGGTLTLVINEVSYTPSSITDDLFFGSLAAGTGQHSASLLDILSYQDPLSAADVQDVFYGTVPLLHQIAYDPAFSSVYVIGFSQEEFDTSTILFNHT
jgi:hypothetical protein